MLERINRPYPNPKKTAIISHGSSFSYEELQVESQNFASLLLENQKDLFEERVAFMVSPNFDYVTTQWGIWLAGGIAVPLCTTHPLPSLQYVIEDSKASIIVVSTDYVSILKELAFEKNIRFIILSEIKPNKINALPKVEITRKAMILYTSGTTNLPKGVVTTHANIQAQVTTLVDAWEYSENDYILCILPLHHVHGIINVISCTLWKGGTVEFLPNFNPITVFDWMEKMINQNKQGVFMAVPTIYFKLIAHFETLNTESQIELSEKIRKFRLMVSGSAALPISVMEKWEKISGHRLLERYGMTEIGMGISNPYHGERRAGHIGQALEGVSVRLVDEKNKLVETGTAGEIQINGENVFQEYWQKPEATKDTFTDDGWFKTGDVAVLNDNYYKILGRNSIDIIKSGGYKISALEIEEILRTHPHVKDCAVVGIEDEEWGEIVAAAIVSSVDQFDTDLLRAWLKEQLPPYRVPRKFHIVNELPRNAMGKVTKNDVKKWF